MKKEALILISVFGITMASVASVSHSVVKSKPDGLFSIDSQTSLIFRKLDDKVRYLGRRRSKLLAKDRNLQNDLLNYSPPASAAIYGFCWEKGRFQRCAQPEHFNHYALNITDDGDTTLVYRKKLAKRYNYRKPLQEQMQCMLYVKMVKMSRLENMGFIELIAHFKSNCFNKIQVKYFVLDQQRRLPNNLRFKFNGIPFRLRFAKEAFEENGKNLRKKAWSYRLEEFYVARKFDVIRPKELFPVEKSKSSKKEGKNRVPKQTEETPAETDTDSETEAKPAKRKVRYDLPFTLFNTSYEIIPSNNSNPYWSYQDIEKLWKGSNPQDCTLEDISESLDVFDQLTNRQMTYTGKLAVMDCSGF